MLELLQKYPEAGKVVKLYYLDILLKGLRDENLPEDFKEHVRAQGIEDDKIAAMIGSYPRSLFDVFDDNNVLINVICDCANKTFTWSVNDGFISKVYIFRKAAEQDAVAEAFKLLNDALTNIK